VPRHVLHRRQSAKVIGTKLVKWRPGDLSRNAALQTLVRRDLHVGLDGGELLRDGEHDI
jgi:hypothetical protein